MSMIPDEKKWKRGDIGPDGRVFWQYSKTQKYKNNEVWIKDRETFNSRLEKAKEQAKKNYLKNRTLILQKLKITRSEDPEKERKRVKDYQHKNKDKAYQRQKKWRDENRDYRIKQQREFYHSNKSILSERDRRRNIAKRFKNEWDGSSLESWLSSLSQPVKIFQVVAKLTPNEGQTLAELIHELSGYAMEVCEQIANPPLIEDTKEPPPVIEDSPELTPPPAEDLF